MKGITSKGKNMWHGSFRRPLIRYISTGILRTTLITCYNVAPVHARQTARAEEVRQMLQIFQKLQCLTDTSILTMICKRFVYLLTRNRSNDNPFLAYNRPFQLSTFPATASQSFGTVVWCACLIFCLPSYIHVYKRSYPCPRCPCGGRAERPQMVYMNDNTSLIHQIKFRHSLNPCAHPRWLV